MRKIKKLSAKKFERKEGSVWRQIQCGTVAEGTCAMEKGREMGKHHSRVASFPEKKQSSLEALTPSNPGHQRGQQRVLSQEGQLGILDRKPELQELNLD